MPQTPAKCHQNHKTCKPEKPPSVSYRQIQWRIAIGKTPTGFFSMYKQTKGKGIWIAPPSKQPD